MEGENFVGQLENWCVKVNMAEYVKNLKPKTQGAAQDNAVMQERRARNRVRRSSERTADHQVPDVNSRANAASSSRGKHLIDRE